MLLLLEETPQKKDTQNIDHSGAYQEKELIPCFGRLNEAS